MATTSTAQIDPSTIDQLGASVVTATKSAANTRFGSIYDPVALAAGAPVHFHPMPDGSSFLTVFSRRWTAATPSTTRTGFYSAYTQDQHPSWFLAGASGAATAVSSTPAVPVATPADTVVLRDGTGRAPNYLYLLHTATTGGVAQGLVQHFRVDTSGRVVAVDEETVPSLTSPAVVFDKGVDFTTPNITVYGTDSSGNLYLARKPWGAIGSSGTDSSQRGKLSTDWEYHTGTGWSRSASDAGPLPGITSAGPVSVAMFRKTLYVSAVKASGAVRSAQVYSRKIGQKFTPLGSPVALGSTADGSYLGGTLQLQPQLLATSASVNTPASETAIPAVSSVKSRVSGQDSLIVSWSAVQIPRQS